MLPPRDRRKTQMADLLGFGGGSPSEAPLLPPMPSARQEPHAALEGIAFPAPLPWLQPAQPGEGGGGGLAPKGALLPRPLASNAFHERGAPPAAVAASLDLEARLAASEQRGASRDKQGELLERLSTALQQEVQDQKARLLQLKEGQGQLLDRMSSNLQELAQDQKAQISQLHGTQDARSLAAEARLGELEQQARRAEAAAQEQARRLQGDIRELAMQALGRQRTELEEEVTRALTRQSASLDEVHSATKARSSQLQSDVDRLGSSTEELGAQLLALQTELRSRLSQLEASRLGGGWGQQLAVGGVGAAAGVPVPGLDAAANAVEHLRHQLSELRAGASQADAGLVELRGRLESEAARTAAAKRDNEARLASLGHALQAERRDLHQAIAQRVEVLEGRLGVERSDLLAQQSDLREELLTGDQDVGARLRDLGAQLRAEVETAERRLRTEVLGLRDQLESQLMQAQTKHVGGDDAQRASAAALARRLDGSAELSAEALKGLKREVDAGLQDVREAVRSEASQRAEAERRLTAELRESFAAAGAQVAGVGGALEKQAAALAAELERTRRAGAERADSLSRYVDEAIATHVRGQGPAARTTQAPADPPRLSAALGQLQSDLREQGQHFEKRLQALDEEQRQRLRRAEEAAEREAGTVRKEAERTAAAAERRTAAAQEELKARFESYARNFDSAISSVQAAVLRVPRSEASAPAARASTLAGVEAARAGRRPDRSPPPSSRRAPPMAEDLPPRRPSPLPPEEPPWASRPPEAPAAPWASRPPEAPRPLAAEEGETVPPPAELDDDWGEARGSAGGSEDASAGGAPGHPPAMSGIQLEALSAALSH